MIVGNENYLHLWFWIQIFLTGSGVQMVRRLDPKFGSRTPSFWTLTSIIGREVIINNDNNRIIQEYCFHLKIRVKCPLLWLNIPDIIEQISANVLEVGKEYMFQLSLHHCRKLHRTPTVYPVLNPRWEGQYLGTKSTSEDCCRLVRR